MECWIRFPISQELRRPATNGRASYLSNGLIQASFLMVSTIFLFGKTPVGWSRLIAQALMAKHVLSLCLMIQHPVLEYLNISVSCFRGHILLVQTSNKPHLPTLRPPSFAQATCRSSRPPQPTARMYRRSRENGPPFDRRRRCGGMATAARSPWG